MTKKNKIRALIAQHLTKYQVGATVCSVKVVNPLHSESASGSLGGITYRRTRGQNVVSNKAKPSNPNTEKQQDARFVTSLHADFVVHANASTAKAAGQELTPKGYLISVKVAPATWSSSWLKTGASQNYNSIKSRRLVWDGLTNGEQSAWTTANAGLARPFEAKTPLNGDAEIAAGEMWFLYQYHLYGAGYLPAVPSATPVAFS